jgi:phospholipase C
MSEDTRHEITRRQLIGAGTGAGAAMLAGGSLARAMAAASTLADRRLRSEVKHIVVLMQENRSFDTYFGTMRGVLGFQDPGAITLPTGRSVFYQPAPNPAGYELPFHMDTTATSSACVADLSHGWTALHQGWDGGKMDNWISAQQAADGATNGLLTMGYYDRNDIPFHYALADAFTVLDGYHCSVFGPTNPNRIFLMTGMNDAAGRYGGPVVDNREPVPGFTWTTYPERLQAAGVTWQIYQEANNYDDNALAWFARFQTAPKSSELYKRGMQPQSSLVDRFAEDVARHRLPQVSWIVGPDYTSEHPSYLPAEGAQFINDILTPLRENPDVWRQTALILNYDECDGFFDHVSPPTAPPGTPGEYVSPTGPGANGISGPVGLGIRVPAVLISPWSTGGYACGDTFDHTSCIRLMERVFGVREPNISAWRRQTAGDLTSGFDFSVIREFPDLPSPYDPAPNGPPADVNAEQAECFVAPGGSALAPPAPPAANAQTVPTQEPGTRPRRGISAARQLTRLGHVEAMRKPRHRGRRAAHRGHAAK